MQFKLGDFVRFVDENIEGYITRIIDKDTIGVTDENDFEIPVMASKVTLIHGDIPEEDFVVRNRPATTASAVQFISDGIYLALVTDQHINSIAHFHVINETSYQLLSALTTDKDGHFRGEFSGVIPPNSTKKIYSANLAEIQLWPKFRLETICYTTGDQEPKPPIIYHQSIKGKDLSVAKEDIALLKQKGWLIRLDKPEPTLDLKKLQDSF